MSERMLARTIDQLERVSVTRVFALSLVLITAVHIQSIQDPPYWDALMGAFAQGHWLASHSFSPLALLRNGGTFNDGGACVYPFSVYPWITGGLEQGGLAPTSAFFLLHLLSFVSAAAIVAGLFGFVRRHAGAGLATCVAFALLVQPMFRALACQMNMDVPLAACTLFSIAALVRGRFGRASMWATAALLVKPTAIILIVANLCALVLRRVKPEWFRRDPLDTDVADARSTHDIAWSRRVRTATIVHVILLAIFLGELLVSAHFKKSPPGMSLFGGTGPFLMKRLWTLPEFGAGLAVFIVLVPWIVLRIRRGSARAIEIDLCIFLIAFTGFYCQYENVLPRYFLQAWPLLLAVLVICALELSVPRRAIGVALALFAIFGLVNAHGRFHPTRFADWREPGSTQPLVSNDGWLLERSLEYQDDIALDQELVVRLQRHPEGVVIAGWPILQLLALPEMGFVIVAPDLVSAEVPIEYAAQPILRVGDARRTIHDAVRVVSPNVYASPSSRVLPGDEVLDVVTKGRLRAFLVRRPADSAAERR